MISRIKIKHVHFVIKNSNNTLKFLIKLKESQKMIRLFNSMMIARRWIKNSNKSMNNRPNKLKSWINKLKQWNWKNKQKKRSNQLNHKKIFLNQRWFQKNRNKLFNKLNRFNLKNHNHRKLWSTKKFQIWNRFSTRNHQLQKFSYNFSLNLNSILKITNNTIPLM